MSIFIFSSALLHDFGDGLNTEEFPIVKLHFPIPPCKADVKISSNKCIRKSIYHF